MEREILKTCSKHGETMHVIDSTKTRYRCRKCRVEAVDKRRRTLKVKAVRYKGGSCVKCGYNKCLSALDFHHINPEEKDFSLSSDGRTKSWEIMRIELDKCILVCANCHREIHDAQFNKPTVVEYIPVKKDKSCLICNKSFVVGLAEIDKQYCSQECFKFSIRKVKERPSKEQLLEELTTTSYVQLGKKYGVSDNTIRKWIK